MQTNSPFLDDLARMTTAAGGTLLEWRREMERMFQESVDKMAARMQLVSREEFEVVREMAEKARAENAALKKRLDTLEKAKKPAASKAAAMAKKS